SAVSCLGWLCAAGGGAGAAAGAAPAMRCDDGGGGGTGACAIGIVPSPPRPLGDPGAPGMIGVVTVPGGGGGGSEEAIVDVMSDPMSSVPSTDDIAGDGCWDASKGVGI